ncbi:MAG: outer membrane protein assembly factor BamD [Rikenellaceae bacterium]
MTKIKNITLQLTAVILVALTAASCGGRHKILKSGDPVLIYRTAMDYYEAKEWKKAIPLYEAAENYYLGTEREDSLLFYKARCYFKDNDFERSTTLFDEFRRTYGRSVFLEDVEGMFTLSYYYLSPNSNRDKSITTMAISAIDEFLSRYPRSEQKDTFLEIRAELVGRLHQKSYDNAYIYFKIGRYKSAIVAFRNALKEYPDSEHRESISFYILASAYELAHNSVESKREDRYLSMIDAYYTFIAEFPKSEQRVKADKMLKEARNYIAKKREAEARGEVKEERVLFWKRLFGKQNKSGAEQQKIEKVEIEERPKDIRREQK